MEVFIIFGAGIAFVLALLCAILWFALQALRFISWVCIMIFARKKNEESAKVQK